MPENIANGMRRNDIGEREFMNSSSERMNPSSLEESRARKVAFTAEPAQAGTLPSQGLNGSTENDPAKDLNSEFAATEGILEKSYLDAVFAAERQCRIGIAKFTEEIQSAVVILNENTTVPDFLNSLFRTLKQELSNLLKTSEEIFQSKHTHANLSIQDLNRKITSTFRSQKLPRKVSRNPSIVYLLAILIVIVFMMIIGFGLNHGYFNTIFEASKFLYQNVIELFGLLLFIGIAGQFAFEKFRPDLPNIFSHIRSISIILFSTMLCSEHIRNIYSKT